MGEARGERAEKRGRRRPTLQIIPATNAPTPRLGEAKRGEPQAQGTPWSRLCNQKEATPLDYKADAAFRKNDGSPSEDEGAIFTHLKLLRPM